MKRAALLVLLALAVTGCAPKHKDPAELYNKQAQVPNSLPFDPLQWRVITSGADKPTSTMWTLYGNDAAVDYARASATPYNYPAATVLALVTWSQQDDPHWFGAEIPGPIKSVEFVQFLTEQPNGKTTAGYTVYEGAPLAKAPDADAATQSARIAAISTLRASVMPTP